VHSVVFGGFASNELAVRIDDAKPKVIVSASCGIEPGRIVDYKPLLDNAIDLAAHKPGKCIIVQRAAKQAELIPGRDLDWKEQMEAATPHDCVPVAATDPLYILYTSGTTGEPKGVVRDNGGHIVALKWSMKNIYGVEPGEVYWAASDVGWVVGHSYIVYAPLFNGNTTVLYEGKPVGTPDAGAFWRVIAQHEVAAMFTAPTAFRAIKKEDPEGKLIGDYDLSRFRTLFLAGERTDPDTLHWAEDKLGVPVIDHWWQTETGWSICANCIGIEKIPVKQGSPSKAVPGMDVRVLDDNAKPVEPGDVGALVIKLPLPPGTFPTLWNCPSFPATTRPQTPASSMKTATCSSCRAPTTSSTWPDTGCLPALWKKCWRHIRMSPSARWWVSRISSKANCRWVFWCSTPASTARNQKSSAKW
jgi:propionyl-CoA synthetase